METIKMIIDYKEWGIFLKRLVMLVLIGIIGGIIWVTIGSVITAPFYSITKEGSIKWEISKNVIEGENTSRAIQKGIDELVEDGLITNFIGVRSIIDNKLYEQIGMIEMYRVSMNGLENNLGRNRGTGGANHNLVQARSDIYADYEIPMFTSYTTKLKETRENIEKYIKELKEDKEKGMESKRAVFIVNSDNLSEMLDKMKQQLQTNLAMKPRNFTEIDDKFYRIRGNLIGMELVLKGIEEDFKEKMKDKTAYEENYKPIMEDLERAVKENHIIVLETLGHLSKMEKEGNVITQKLAEVIDKLKKG